jgi:crotonobetainyl-CoA:carnitine CoA-transferase CaiB-like acyl-CoA transferase
MRLFSGTVDRAGPVFSALQVGVHACAQSAVAGILAALLARGENGAGRLVETSLLQGMLPYEMGAMIGTQFADQFPDLLPLITAPPAQPPMPSLFYHPAQAGDGLWMQFGNLLPHLFDNFLIATELIDVVTDEDFNPKQLLLKTPEKQEAFRLRMLNRIQERSAAEWMQDFISDGGIVATTYQTSQQALQDPDIVANGHVIERQNGGLQLGPVARLTDTPAQPGEDATTDDSWALQWLANPRPQAKDTSPETLPLTGIRVVEIATIIAAPLGAAFLADMGAEVIKIEQLGGDPFRGMLAGLGSARVNVGKRSMSINLKTATGLKIVLDLLKDADVMIHNFRPGVPERLGISYSQVSAINSDIIYLQCNGYGSNGPGASRPSTHPIPGAAMGGVMYQMGEHLPEALQDAEGLKTWCRRLMRANEVNPDPNTALVVTTSVMLGLLARQKTGTGQQILVDMFGANAYANSDDFLTYPGKQPRSMPDTDLFGLSPIYRLYPCAEQQWVFLGLNTSREIQQFCNALKAANLPAPDANEMRTGDESLIKALTNLFSSKNARQWQSLLGHLGCVQADGPAPNQFWTENEQVKAMHLTSEVEHPAWGRYRRHGAVVMFDGKQQPLAAPPLAGQHNSALLSQLGYSKAQIDALYQQGTLWQEPS